jgi:hypothetical protein
MVHVISPLRTPAQTNPAVHRQVPATAEDTASDPVADFRSLFTQKISPTATVPTPQPAPSPSPTAESVFGASPWLANPTGVGPNNTSYGYNPFYFGSPDTAAKVAQMVGGTVVQSNQFTGTGGAFTQQQPNQMVQLPDGRMINPGLIASFYTHGYPQSYVDTLVANEVKNA